ncbi:MAG: hypothetical protein JW737_00265 [Acidobacteria bacterium]|nr:hypothetical protein [Acidobacteriota bacterium]
MKLQNLINSLRFEYRRNRFAMLATGILMVIAGLALWLAVWTQIESDRNEAAWREIATRPHATTYLLYKKIERLNSRMDDIEDHLGYLEAKMDADASMVDFLLQREEMIQSPGVTGSHEKINTDSLPSHEAMAGKEEE